jgi:hypothetical protein
MTGRNIFPWERQDKMAKTKKTTKIAPRPIDYFPDLGRWPNHWMYAKEDLKIGRGLLALFTRFIQHLIDEGLAKRTIKNQGSHLAALGGEIIWSLNRLDEKNRKLSPRDLVLQYINDPGGPLFSDWDASDKTELSRQLAFDATCRKFFKFMTRKNT